ncbi:hypothetical protein THAOC_12156, partial [Thalassiosira oceanica]
IERRGREEARGGYDLPHADDHGRLPVLHEGAQVHLESGHEKQHDDAHLGHVAQRRLFGLAADGVHDDPRGDEGDDARLADVGQSQGQDGRDSEQEAHNLDNTARVTCSTPTFATSSQNLRSVLLVLLAESHSDHSMNHGPTAKEQRYHMTEHASSSNKRIREWRVARVRPDGASRSSFSLRLQIRISTRGLPTYFLAESFLTTVEYHEL